MKPDDIPPEIWSKAYSISEAAKAECAERGLFLGTGNALDVYDHHIARALLEAERRGKQAGIAEGLERAAEMAYVACAETRHVTLGDKCRDAIRAAKEIEP